MEKYCNTEPPHRHSIYAPPFGTLRPSVVTSYMLETLGERASKKDD